MVIDAPSVAALDVATELGIPAYTFFASNASVVAMFLQLLWMRAEGQPSFKELGHARAPIEFHGVPPISALEPLNSGGAAEEALCRAGGGGPSVG